MAHKKKHAEHVNNERWLVSYADFMTLLFAFFTSLYAISTVDAKKAGKMVFSTRAAFNLEFFTTDKQVLGGSDGNTGGDLTQPKTLIQRAVQPMPPLLSLNHRKPYSPDEVRKLAKNLDSYIKRANLGEKISVKLQQRTLIVSLAAAAFFDSGTADMRSESLHLLDTVAQMLVVTGHNLTVEGHTDDRPISSMRYRSNWELSTARSATVIAYLMEEFAFPPQLLTAAGYASYHPVADNNTPEGRVANRRVDLVLHYGSGGPSGSGSEQSPTDSASMSGQDFQSVPAKADGGSAKKPRQFGATKSLKSSAH